MNIKYCKSSSWQALRKHLSFTFFRQQITLSRAVLRLDRGQSLWDSYLFQGCHFSGFPTKQASPLLPITTSSSNHRVQGCWGPWLNAQLLISAHSSRPCSSWSSKARNWPRRKGSSKHQVQFSVPLFLGSKLRWFCFFFFFPSSSPMRLPKAMVNFSALNSLQLRRNHHAGAPGGGGGCSVIEAYVI